MPPRKKARKKAHQPKKPEAGQPKGAGEDKGAGKKAEVPGFFEDLLSTADDLAEDLLNVLQGKAEPTSASKKATRRHPTESEARTAAIYETFLQGLQKRDSAFLAHAVLKYGSEVAAWSDPNRLRIYAEACLVAENPRLALDTYHRIGDSNLRPIEHGIVGLIKYQDGRLNHAVNHLKIANKGGSVLEMNLALSSIAATRNNADPDFHLGLLRPFLGKSATANYIMSVLHYNLLEYQTAGRYATTAAQLAPQSEKVQLHSLRVQFAQGRAEKVWQAIGTFYHTTSSTLSSDEIQTEFGKTAVPFPTILFKRSLYDILHPQK